MDTSSNNEAKVDDSMTTSMTFLALLGENQVEKLLNHLNDEVTKANKKIEKSHENIKEVEEKVEILEQCFTLQVDAGTLKEKVMDLKKIFEKTEINSIGDHVRNLENLIQNIVLPEDANLEDPGVRDICVEIVEKIQEVIKGQDVTQKYFGSIERNINSLENFVKNLDKNV